MLFLTVLIEKPKYPLVPVFVSVDSERDTPDVLAKYVKGNKKVFILDLLYFNVLSSN